MLPVSSGPGSTVGLGVGVGVGVGVSASISASESPTAGRRRRGRVGGGLRIVGARAQRQERDDEDHDGRAQQGEARAAAHRSYPAARPARAIRSAILRLASSIISPSKTAAPAPLRVRLVVGGEHRLGALPLLLRGAEDLIDDRDLAGVDRPLAVEAERARESRARAQPVVVADAPVGPVDRLNARRARRDDQPGVDVVEVVAGVAVRRRADRRDRDADRRAVVARAEDQRLHPRGGGGDRLAGQQPGRVLDLRLDPDPADLEPAARARSASAAWRSSRRRRACAPSGA